MKTVRIIVPEVFDGLGGIHKAGAVVALPADIAAIFIERKCAVEAEDVDKDEAKRRAKQVEEDRRMAEQKARAESAMSLHDMMPPDVRTAANEHGGDVTNTYINEQFAARIKEFRASKAAPAPQIDGDDPFAEIDRLEDDAKPTRKRRGKKYGKRDEQETD